MDVRPENRHIRRPLERGLSRQAFVRRRPASRRRRARRAPPLDLLGRDVVERPDDLVRGRQAADRTGALGQAEVGEVAVLAAGGASDEHVARLHVAVDEPLFVGGVEGARGLLRERDDALGVERPFVRDEPREIRALHVAHREEEHSLGFPCPEDRNDVRMVERGGQLRLAQEALPEALVARVLGREDLQRHRPTEIRVPGAVDRAHAAASEQDVDVIPADFAADERIRTPSSDM